MIMKEGTPVEVPSMSLVSLVTSAGSKSVLGSKRKAGLADLKSASIGNKQNKKPRRRWKKPKGKPKRPLSAYNLYFKAERERMLRDDKNMNLGFRDMAKIIAAKWNELAAKDRVPYEGPAKEERSKYFTELAKWKKAQQQKQVDELFDQQMETLYDTFSGNSEETGDNNEPLPIAHASNASVLSTKSVADKTDKKQNEFLASTLQMASDLSNDTLKLTGETSIETVDFKCNGGIFDGLNDLEDFSTTMNVTNPTMQRILKSCEALNTHIDDEFHDFMSSLDWDGA